jgi:hypothetical protein
MVNQILKYRTSQNGDIPRTIGKMLKFIAFYCFISAVIVARPPKFPSKLELQYDFGSEKQLFLYVSLPVICRILANVCSFPFLFFEGGQSLLLPV